MDQYRCTAPSCEFTAQSVKIAYSHKQQTGHTLELMGSGSSLVQIQRDILAKLCSPTVHIDTSYIQ